VLRYFADLPVRDTAVVMGCAEGTVKALTFKAIAALRAQGLVDDEEYADV
jgi:DNA-directed RNA polymerase specialized sigma24 family protein